MKKSIVLVIVLVMVLLLASSIGASAAQAAPGGNSCWGQASAVFARMGEMGEPFAQLLISNAKSGCSDTSAFCYVVLKQDLRS